ncbi:MAG: hypothetical protein ACLQVG_09990 [Terriglobia bacterium]
MDFVAVINALGPLDKLLSEAQSSLRQIEADIFGFAIQGGRYEYPEPALAMFLGQIHDRLLVVLEAAGLSETRSMLSETWKKLTDAKDGLRHTDCHGEGEFCESPALTLLQNIVEGLRMSSSGGISSEEAWTLNRLEAMLRDTPALVHRRANSPELEHELQKIMHDYLSACFSDFQLNPPIGGTLKFFKPDCGIRSVAAAIEFKFVRKKEDVAVAFSGVAEDTAGYKGSKDWSRFYAVFYQVEPIILESHVRSDLKRIGAATWTPIVVNAAPKAQAKRSAKNRRFQRR